MDAQNLCRFCVEIRGGLRAWDMGQKSVCLGFSTYYLYRVE